MEETAQEVNIHEMEVEELHTLRMLRERYSTETVELVRKSWHRCQEYGVPRQLEYPMHVLSDDEMRILEEKNQLLMEISKPIMNSVKHFMEGSRFIVALTDADGVILQIDGDEKMMEAVKEGGFIKGADWSEKSAGTNAIGTALAEGQPLQLSGFAHYCVFTQRTACACAPIRSPKGKIIGSVDLTGRFRDINRHTLGMTVAMSSAIRNMLRISVEHHKAVLSEAYKNAIMQSISQGVIALDGEGCLTHINKVASRLLQIPEDSVGMSLRNLLDGGDQELFTLLEQRDYVMDREVLIRTKSGDIRLLITSQYLADNKGERAGIVIVMDEPKRMKRLAGRYSGATARLSFHDLVGSSHAFIESVRLAKTAAMSNASVLLLGESGTGKDVFAQSIHNASHRRNGPFVAINCGALPRELVASTLFGYVDGAFTGARKGGSPGQFEMADGGTIFLDEIGEMPLDIQVHLLRVLESRTVTRVGSTEAIPVDVRIISATNANLRDAVENGYFREDLYYRLNVITFRLPPLRERKEDIPALTQYIYHQLYPDGGTIPADFLQALQAWNWPGNIRELRNVVERAGSLSGDNTLQVKYLPAELREPYGKAKTLNQAPLSIPSSSRISDLEKDMLERLMDNYQGNITKVAKEMGVARTTVYRKLKKYRLIGTL